MAVKKSHFDLTSWLQSNLVWVITVIVAGATFYFTTNNTLSKHEEQFREVGKKFDTFNETLKASNTTAKQNFDEWMKINRAEQEKAERNAKEERDTRDKLREQFTTLFTQLSQNAVATKVQVDSITKNLDLLQGKIDGISTVQQEGRILRQQQQQKR